MAKKKLIKLNREDINRLITGLKKIPFSEWKSYKSQGRKGAETFSKTYVLRRPNLKVIVARRCYKKYTLVHEYPALISTGSHIEMHRTISYRLNIDYKNNSLGASGAPARDLLSYLESRKVQNKEVNKFRSTSRKKELVDKLIENL